MIFSKTLLQGAFIIELVEIEDARGFFARTWCQQEAAEHGLHPVWVQCNLSFNHTLGTLRGMHYQAAPYAEAKLVQCTRGAIYDVIIDLRPESPTFKQHEAVILTAQNHRMLYVPEGFAHGFQTLKDNTEVFYHMSCVYTPEYARGVRWNDPAFGIQWPDANRIISERDQSYADFRDEKKGKS